MDVTGFEQFEVGQTFTSPPRPVGRAAVKAFAAQFDPQPQHLAEAAAEQTLFGTLVASGWHTASLTMRLVLDSALAGVNGRGLGVRVSDLTWLKPVSPEDELHAVTEVMQTRASRSKPDRGFVVLRTVTHNAAGAMVQEMTSTVMVLRSDAVLSPATPP